MQTASQQRLEVLDKKNIVSENIPNFNKLQN